MEFPNKKLLGHCTACGEEVIDLSKKDKRASAKFLLNYREHTIMLSNDTLMRVSVCVKCKAQLTSGDATGTAKKIVENHIKYWKNHIKEAPVGYAKYKCIHPNMDFASFIRLKEKKIREQKLLNLISNK